LDVRRYVRPALVALAIVGVVVLVLQSGVADHVRDEKQLRETVDNAGVFGPLLFVGLMVLLVPLNVPGILFVVPSVAMFGTVGGVVLSTIGANLASAVSVIAARRLGRNAFETRMPPRIRRLEERLARHGFWGIVVIRCLTFLLQPADWLCGISSIPLRTILAATFVGLIPPTLVIALGGGSLFSRVL
jgi:uncharacterized membrane protein YdjX (TVP38/TMEM64 family)